MKRFHGVEIEDLPGCPEVIREACTAFISRIIDVAGILDGAAPLVVRLVDATEDGQVVDLCSGSGGPACWITRQVPGVHVHCTDLYPHQEGLARAATTSDHRLSWSSQPVDARAVPRELPGARTLFNAFHHFEPDDARRILEDAVRCGAPIGVFEIVSRQPAILPTLLGIPLAVLALVPLMRPFRWAWLPLTYLVPVLPFVIGWDGTVSCLRVYSPAQLRELVEGLDSFEWEIGTFGLPIPGRGTYLLGLPRRAADA